MTWLTKLLSEFIDENPGHTITWYAKRFGCSQPTASKVIREKKIQLKKPKRPVVHLTRKEKYARWLENVGMIIKLRERKTDDWQHWVDWEAMYNDKLTPMQACRKAGVRY